VEQNMYNTDNKFVNDFCQDSAKNLAHCHAEVQVTIQMNTEALDGIATDFKKNGINIAVFNWGQKKKAVEHFNANMHYYYNNMMSILASKKGDVPDRILQLFLEVEGLGLAKASFLAQLATGHKAFACLDSNNLIWHKIDPKVTGYNKKLKSDIIKAEKRRQYFAVVKKLGGGEKLWNDWCVGVADKSKKFKSGVQVSFKHRHWFTTWQNQYPTI
jgi:hypothetical protein